MAELFISNIAALDSENPSYRFCLDDQRLARMDAYRQKLDKQRCLGAGLLLHHLLGGNVASELRVGNYGKPYLANGPHFNISHSGDLVLLACSETGPVGCDIEQCVPQDYTPLAKKAFHQHEQQQLSKSPNQMTAFYRIWTLRESFAKAVGFGFSLDKDSYYFDLSHTSSVNVEPSRSLLPEGSSDDSSKSFSKESLLLASHRLKFQEFNEVEGYRIALGSLEGASGLTWVNLCE